MKAITLLSLCIIFFASCEKDSEDVTQADQSFDINLALVDSASIAYFIADVEGIDGVSKINYQVGATPAWTYPHCNANSGRGGCPVGMEEHSTEVTYRETQNTFKSFSVHFRYLCPTTCSMTELVKTGSPDFMTESNGGGIMVNYWEGSFVSSENVNFYSYLHNNNSDPESSMEVLTLVQKPYEVSSHEITMRFNATLLSPDKTKTIKIKNAVYKSYIGLIY